MRVLMIEDERDTAEALSWDLTAAGYVVDLAGNGVDGLWKGPRTPARCSDGQLFHAE
jgi:DNA-binding response OmpR family regulator